MRSPSFSSILYDVFRRVRASLLAAVRGNGTDTLRPEIHYEFDYRSAARQLESSTDMDQHLLWVIRDAEYKYVHFADERMPPLLFDLRSDPSEFENLASRPEHAHTVLTYCQRLLRWRMRHEDQRMEHWSAQYRYA